MSTPAYPIINGFVPSFASVEIKLAGTSGAMSLPGVKSINYKDALSISKVYGNSPRPQGRTRGQLAATGSIEFYRDMWDAATLLLSGGGAWGFAEKSWVIPITYAETLYRTTCDTLIGVRVHSPDTSPSEGTEALTVKCELDIMQIEWNGFSQLSNSNIFTAAG
jgi:hypothetical protein